MNEEILKYIDERIEFISKHRNTLYDAVDVKHYSNSNLYIFQIIQEFTIRIDELYELKSNLTTKK